MADNKTPEYRPRCMYMDCKSMMVYGDDFEQDPDFQAGLVELDCTKTGTNRGPDSHETSLEMCSDPKRTCFQEY